jgi:arsenite-transporting ATPase
MFKEREIVGDELEKLANEIYGEKDPAEVFVTEKPMKIIKDDEGYSFYIKAPFIRKEEVKLMKRGDELIVVAGQWKRIVFLPQSLALKDAVKASFNNGEIKILFR